MSIPRDADELIQELVLASPHGTFVLHYLVDVAGDLVTGVLLSQIIYWYRGDKLRVKRGDRLWLVKRREDWWTECRIRPRQFDRAIDILRAKGLVETEIHRFSGFPTVHVWLNLAAVSEGVKTVLTKRGYERLPDGDISCDESVRTLTETTYRDYLTETTSVPKDFVPTKIEEALFKLPYWKPDPEADRVWLAEFSIEYPELTLAHIIACRDHWDGRRVSHKGQWKSRLRNWMRIDREKGDRPRRGTKDRRVLPDDDALSKKAQSMGLHER